MAERVHSLGVKAMATDPFESGSYFSKWEHVKLKKAQHSRTPQLHTQKAGLASTKKKKSDSLIRRHREA